MEVIGKFERGLSFRFAVLPLDATLNSSPRLLRGVVGALVSPPTPNPSLECVAVSLIALRDIFGDAIDEENESHSGTPLSALAQFFCGNVTIREEPVLALNYAGVQFGSFVEQLGDGRCITIFEGELRNGSGVAGRGNVVSSESATDTTKKYRRTFFDLQLKGRCETPFRRHLDGLLTAEKAMAEYVWSEALAQLGVLSTRGVALFRWDCFSAGLRRTATAVLCRSVYCSLRIGSFEVHFCSGRFGTLKELADWTLNVYVDCESEQMLSAKQTKKPRLEVAHANISGSSPTDTIEGSGVESEDERCSMPYIRLLRYVCVSLGKMFGVIQAHGFTHGALNSDNASIVGMLLDFDTCGMLPGPYDERFVSLCADDERLYAFGKQPQRGYELVNRMARALSPLLDPHALLDIVRKTNSPLPRNSRAEDLCMDLSRIQRAVDHACCTEYWATYRYWYLRTMLQKMKVDLTQELVADRVSKDAEKLIELTVQMLRETAVPYVSFFQQFESEQWSTDASIKRVKKLLLHVFPKGDAGELECFIKWENMYRLFAAGLSETRCKAEYILGRQDRKTLAVVPTTEIIQKLTVFAITVKDARESQSVIDAAIRWIVHGIKDSTLSQAGLVLL